MLLISVRDSGIGIATDVLPTLFQPFTQIFDASGLGRGGLGLGLTLVKSLAELHGGTTVEAHSAQLGTGSEFVLRLPLPKPALDEVSTASKAPSTARALPRRRILVIDDSPNIADPFAVLLRLNEQLRLYEGQADYLSRSHWAIFSSGNLSTRYRGKETN